MSLKLINFTSYNSKTSQNSTDRNFIIYPNSKCKLSLLHLTFLNKSLQHPCFIRLRTPHSFSNKQHSIYLTHYASMVQTANCKHSSQSRSRLRWSVMFSQEDISACMYKYKVNIRPLEHRCYTHTQNANYI